jgi:hypothetical protein
VLRSEKEFRDQWADSPPFLDQRVVSFARQRGVGRATTFRFASPDDADALVGINKVGPPTARASASSRWL